MVNSNLRFDPYLPATNLQFLQAMARVWSGKGKRRKDDCINGIIDGLKSPRRVEAVITSLAPFERLSLELIKQQGGEIEASQLLTTLRLLGAKLPPLDKQYGNEAGNFAKSLVQRGIALGRFSGYDYYYYAGYAAPTLFADERLLEYVGDPVYPPLPLQPIAPPASAVARRSSAVLLNLISLLQSVEAIQGFRLTKAGKIQANSSRKLLKAMQWQEQGCLIDGLLFPEPAIAFAYALSHSGLLAEKGETLVLQDSLEQFASRSYPEQIGAILKGFIENKEWTEWRTSGWYNAAQYGAGRQILMQSLRMLPDAQAWFSVDDLERILFERIGTHFSIGLLPPRPLYAKTPQEEEKAIAKWQTELRQNWLARERPWLKYALSTWLYYLGLVELGWHSKASASTEFKAAQNESIAGFRLTPLGRSLLYPNQADADLPVTPAQPAWIVQPNFEILVYLEQATPMQLAFLERHAERLEVQQHVLRYRLTRNSIYQGLENGSSLEDLLTGLQAGSQVGVPQNVEVELRQWAGLREQVTLRRRTRLLEFADAKTCQTAAKTIAGTVVGDRFILLSASEQAKGRVGTRVDYEGSLPPCLTVTEEGTVQLTVSLPDLLIQGQLDQWMERLSEDTWQLTRASVAAAVKAGSEIEALFDLLNTRLVHALPALLALALRTWAGERITAGLSSAIVLRATDAAVFRAIANSPKLKPYILGRLSSDSLLVDEQHLNQLQAELDWAGLTISSELLRM